MNLQKLKLKKHKVMELSSGIESLPREKTDNVAGGITISRGYCASLDCGTYTEEPCSADTIGCGDISLTCNSNDCHSNGFPGCMP